MAIYYECKLDENAFQKLIHFGSEQECKEKCIDTGWCKSFDYCKNHGKCSLMSINSEQTVFERHPNIQGQADYYECRSDVQLPVVNVSKSRPTYVLGEAYSRVYTECQMDKATGLQCAGEMMHQGHEPSYEELTSRFKRAKTARDHTQTNKEDCIRQC